MTASLLPVSQVDEAAMGMMVRFPVAGGGVVEGIFTGLSVFPPGLYLAVITPAEDVTVRQAHLIAGDVELELW